MNTAQEVANGLIAASHPDVIATAKKFMTNNGYKLTPQGKTMACDAVSDWAEKRTVSTELRVAIQTAIMML